MKTLIVILILTLQISTVQYSKTYAQGNVQIEWLRNYTGVDSSVVPKAISVDNWGNIYITGYIVTDTTLKDYITIKYDTNGLEAWIAYYNNSTNLSDYGVFISTDNFGNVYVCGNSMDSTFHNDITTIKYNSDGIQQWVTRYNGSGNLDDLVTAMLVDSSGNIYLLGSSRDPVTEFDYVTIKYNTYGIEQWVSTYNDYGDSWDLPRDLIIDDFGNVYVTGNTDRGINILNDFLTIKYDSSGNFQWKAYYGDSQSNDVGKTLTIDRFGNVFVSGHSMGDYTTIKYDPNGIERWIRTYNGTGNAEDHVVEITADKRNNIYVTGYSTGISATNDIATIKYNSNGLQLWIARYDSSAEYPLGVKINNEGELYVAGRTSGYFTGWDFLVLKYDSTGYEEWVTRYNSQGDHEDYMTAFFVDNSNSIYVTGITGELDWWNENWLWSTITTIKYSEVYTGLIQDGEYIIPSKYILYQNYPNPFNSSTIIEYILPKTEFVTLKIFNTVGEQVQNIIQDRQLKGKYKINLDAEQFSSGIYFYQLHAGDFIQTKKLLILK